MLLLLVLSKIYTNLSLASFRALASSGFKPCFSFMLHADFKFRRAFYNVVYCAKFRSFQSLLYFACLQELKYRF